MKLTDLSKKILFIPLLLLFLGLQGCSQDRYKLITHKWIISPDEVSIEFHQDSTYDGSERGKEFKGTWKISEDGKWIITKQKGSGEKRLKIIRLNETNFNLSDNGYAFEYTRAD